LSWSRNLARAIFYKPNFHTRHLYNSLVRELWELLNIEKVFSQRKEELGALLFLVCFLFVAYFRGAFYSINLDVNLWAATFNIGFFTETAKLVSVGFDTVPLLAASLAIAFFLFTRRYRRYSILLLGAMAGDALLVEFFKTIIASPRPLNGIIVETGYSFPSGHTTSSVVLFGILVYVAWRQWKKLHAKVLAVGLYVSEVGVVAFDRIYLNVHWFSDVLGALFLGAFWVTFCVWMFKSFSTLLDSKISKPNQE
jgi:undecaprenyl-diphosphatase